jgi:hypothetical protein
MDTHKTKRSYSDNIYIGTRNTKKVNKINLYIICRKYTLPSLMIKHYYVKLLYLLTLFYTQLKIIFKYFIS